MELQQFKDTVNYFGEDKVYAIIFDNNMKAAFVEEPFTFADNLIEEISAIKIIEEDIRGLKIISTKHIENIQGILFIPEDVPRDAVAARYVLP